MARATGIGGVFFRCKDQAALQAWYVEHLGFPTDNEGFVVLTWGGEHSGSTVWGAFEEDTEYFGERTQLSMINYRVDDLDEMLAQLREADAVVDDNVQTLDGIGRFGWAVDPEGNRFELWEPAPGC